jgi:hypothetical protein
MIWKYFEFIEFFNSVQYNSKIFDLSSHPSIRLPVMVWINDLKGKIYYNTFIFLQDSAVYKKDAL